MNISSPSRAVEKTSQAADFPELSWPWYWHLEVTSGPSVLIYVYLKRRWLGLFTTAIGHHGSDSVLMDEREVFSPSRAAEVAQCAQSVYDARFERREVIRGLKVFFPKIKVTKR